MKLMKSVKRSLVILTLGLIISLARLATTPALVQAQATSAQKAVELKQTSIETAKFTKLENQGSFSTGLWENTQTDILMSTLGGYPEVVATNPDGTPQFSYSHGMVGNMGNAIAMMYGQPPATTERYVADLLNSAGVGIIQPAYAQGLGFASLDPVLATWKTFRNVAYFFFVIIFLAIGIMIMLRQKIGGQTVVTAQQAIPQIVVALLVVTFSYAIAGLLIDAMYLIMYLLLALFGYSGQQGKFLDHNFLSLGWAMIVSGWGSAQEAIEGFIQAALSESTWSWLQGSALETIGGLTLAVVIALAIALQIFKLFFELLKTYIGIILSVAFAPILLMFGAIPGKNPFAQWIGNLIGNLGAFPIVLLVLIMFDQLTNGGFARSVSTAGGGGVDPTPGGFMPPYMLNTGTGFGGVMSFVVGLGMLLIMPEIVKKGKEALGAKETVFDQFTKDVKDSLAGGWKGGEIVPGLGFTDTSKWGEERLGGISGKSFAEKLWGGNEKTRKAAETKTTFFGRGLVPTLYHRYERGKDIRKEKSGEEPNMRSEVSDLAQESPESGGETSRYD